MPVAMKRRAPPRKKLPPSDIRNPTEAFPTAQAATATLTLADRLEEPEVVEVIDA
jgi:hypothetical protein